MKRKITALIVYFLLCYTAFSPVYSFGSSIISDITFTKNENNSVCIDLSSSGKFQYFIYAQKDILYIELKDAKLTDAIYNEVKALKEIDSNVKEVKITSIKDDHYKIAIELHNLKKFKFVLNSKEGIVAPYGFDYKPKSNPNKIKQVNNKSKQSKITVSKNSTSSLSPIAKDYKNINPDDDFIVASHNRIKTNINDNGLTSTRLNDSSVYIPPDYGKKIEKKVEKPATNPTVEIVEKPKEKEVEEIKKPERKEVVYKPIPTDELIKRLQSDVEEMPRLVPQVITDTNNVNVSDKDDTATKTDKIDSNQDVVEGLISTIKPLPKGKAINIDSDSSTALIPKGAKTYEVSHIDNKNHTDLINSDNSELILKSRDLNSLSLGLSEEYDDVTIDDMIDIPAPKPAYTSDGAMAFTVFSSKGTYQGSAPIRPVQTIDQGASFSGYNYSVIERGDNDNQISAKFKNYISDAKSFFRQGKIKQSEDAYRQAIAITPQKPWGYIAISSFYESQNRYDDAIRVYGKAISMLPDKVELRYNQAMNYYKNKDYSNAVESLLGVISKAPEFTLAYYNLGTLYYKMNEPQKAIKYLKKAVTLNPVLTDAQFNLALALIKNGNKAEAKSALYQCTDVDPDDRECSILLNRL